MTEQPPDEETPPHDPETLEELLDEQGAEIRQELQDYNGIIIAFGAVPVFLVIMVLRAILGEWIARWSIWLFIGAFLALFVYIIYRRRMESELPFHIPGHGVFTGVRKRRLLRGGALVLFALIVASLALEIGLGQALAWLRETLMGWRV